MRLSQRLSYSPSVHGPITDPNTMLSPTSVPFKYPGKRTTSVDPFTRSICDNFVITQRDASNGPIKAMTPPCYDIAIYLEKLQERYTRHVRPVFARPTGQRVHHQTCGFSLATFPCARNDSPSYPHDLPYVYTIPGRVDAPYVNPVATPDRWSRAPKTQLGSHMVPPPFRSPLFFHLKHCCIVNMHDLRAGSCVVTGRTDHKSGHSAGLRSSRFAKLVGRIRAWT